MHLLLKLRTPKGDNKRFESKMPTFKLNNCDPKAMENPGKALSREEILDKVWGRDYFGELKIVDVNIRRLRLKIEDNVQNPSYITTVWGYGYKWGF